MSRLLNRRSEYEGVVVGPVLCPMILSVDSQLLIRQFDQGAISHRVLRVRTSIQLLCGVDQAEVKLL